MGFEIVGLKNCLPDNVNSLIFKFLGFPKKKGAEELKRLIELAVKGGSSAVAIDGKLYNCFHAGHEPEYYIRYFLRFKFEIFNHWRLRRRKKILENAKLHIRKMFNKELNKDTTEETRLILKAKFERQPINIQHEILSMALSQNKVKKYLYKGSVPEKIKEEVRNYSKHMGWGWLLN